MTPRQVVLEARGLSLAAVAITDHDTLAGIDEAIETGEEFGITVVPGVEISTLTPENTEAHILGYFFDHHDPTLTAELDVLRNARSDRARKMVEQLNAVGVGVSMERVSELSDGGAIGRPHVARAIIEIGAASSMDTAFGKYLVEGCPGFVPRYKVTPAQAVHMIIAAGGVACCAHVAKLKRDELVLELVKQGLAAIEVYHPDHGPASSRFYKRFALRHGLIITGGSDAHGNPGPKPSSVGCVTVSHEAVEQLRKAASGPHKD
jgi:predicted metal-dependent phosphoesterase TrpH